MNQHGETTANRNRWWIAMLRDPQFWIPLAILLSGLILLSMIQ
jgi:hypothetical protein